MVKVRFAPSPTGMLHIGGARTALFNWLYARHHKGQYFLRIEDTDKERSTQEAVDKIFDSLNWLGLDFDGEVVYQSKRSDRHQQVARDLLEKGLAYYCYSTPEELEQMREEARKNNRPVGYNGFWRDRSSDLAPKGVNPVIRLKMPQDGQTIIHDVVQGDVTVMNKQLDDMILLRADGSPTYMLSVVVDDHDMGITHIIRGDDHLNNAFRQYHLYKACGWDVPIFAHIPLIHGQDGAKLSKRHGAVGTDAYKEMGILPEAMRNYLLRLGWSHGDDEIIPTNLAIEWFNLESIGKSPARFDVNKLLHLNAHYIKQSDDINLMNLVIPYLELEDIKIDTLLKNRLLKGMGGLKERAKTLLELKDSSKIYNEPQDLTEKVKEKIDNDTKKWLEVVLKDLEDKNFSKDELHEKFKKLADENGTKLGVIAMALRIALTGNTVSPNLFEVMEILGFDESVKRIKLFMEKI